MSIAKKVGTDSLISGFRIGVGVVRGLVAIPLITNLLGADSYGIWTLVLAFVAMVVTVGGMHLHGALIRYNDRSDSEEQAYIDILVLTFVVGTVLAIAVYVAGSLVSLESVLSGTVPDERALVTVAAVLVLSEMLFLINISFSRSKGDIKTFETINVLKRVVETVALVAVFLGGGGIVLGLGVLLVIGLVSNVVIMWYVWSRFEVPRPALGNYSKYVSFGLPMVPKELFGSVLVHADKFLVLYFLSPTAVGVYAVAYGVSAMFTKFTDVLNPTLYPTVSKAWDDDEFTELRELYSLIFRYYSMLAIPALVGITLLAEPFLLIISTPEIAARGAPLLPFLAVGFVLRGYDNPLSYILTATEQTDRIGLSVVVAAVVNVGLNLALIPVFGLPGAVAASVASHLVIVILIYRYAAAELSFTVPVESIGKTVGASIVMGLALVSLPLPVTSLMSLVVFPIVGVAVYLTVMVLLDGISRTDVNRFAGLIR